MKTWQTSLFAILFSLGASTLYAEGGNYSAASGMAPPHGMGPGMMAPRPFAGVDFTAAQRETINKLMEQERQAHQERLQKMQAQQQKLQQLYQAEKWDAAAITKLYDEMYAQQRQTIEAMAKARNMVYDLMSKEQREQMQRFQQTQRQQGQTAPAMPRYPAPPR